MIRSDLTPWNGASLIALTDRSGSTDGRRTEAYIVSKKGSRTLRASSAIRSRRETGGWPGEEPVSKPQRAALMGTMFDRPGGQQVG